VLSDLTEPRGELSAGIVLFEDEEKKDSPEEFEGTVDCPECRQTWLVMGHHEKPMC
jgi:hypothetical protein